MSKRKQAKIEIKESSKSIIENKILPDKQKVSNIDLLNINENQQDIQLVIDKMQEIKKIAPSIAKIDIQENNMTMTVSTGNISTTIKEKSGINFIERTITIGVKPTSIDERRKDAEILKKNGKTQKQIADIFQVSQSTISNDLKEKKKIKSL
jgi:predicted transcriptional regulator